MAKVTFTPLLDGELISEIYNPEIISINATENGKRAVLAEAEGGDRIVLSGKGIAFDGEVFTAGKIEKITFMNGENELYLTVDGDFKAKQLSTAYMEGGVEGLVAKLLEGDDVLGGSKGSDYMLGFAGNDKLDGGKGVDWLGGGIGRDVLTGGGGNDIFIFGLGGGKDVIKDFDADSSDDKMDLIWIENGMTYEVGKNADKDAVITFEDGSSVTLDGVRMNQIGDDDFYSPPPSLV
jgi:Ca2+-binding RTX toxin-like protein